MTRAPLANYEAPAREIAHLRGKDPNELSTFYRPGSKEKAMRPTWMNYAEQLRSHQECKEALERHES